MPFAKLQFRPGINREITSYSNEGGWFDCDKIRFRSGFPETIGGWTPFSNFLFQGTCRALYPFITLDGNNILGVGTNLKYYINEGGQYYDITPIRRDVTLGSDPIETQAAGSGVVVITDVGHGAVLNDFVTISGATAVDGLTTDDLNKEHQITQIIDDDTYTVDTGGSATSGSVSGGGASVDAEYQINTGLDTSFSGNGWGTAGWGITGWGLASNSTAVGAQLRTWSHDNFGEDLLFNPHDGGIYYWDRTSGVTARGVSLDSLSGANKAPTVSKFVLVSERDRHVIVFGCDSEVAPGTQDPLLIRFSAQESLTDWETRPDNTAGDLRIGTGSAIEAVVETKQQIIILTDVSVHAMQYLGPPFTFGISEVSRGITIAGRNAVVSIGDVVFWMGQGEFYAYDGAVRQIECAVKDYVFNDFNVIQSQKVFAGHNSSFGEIWWFYPSAASNENDSYVVYNYQQKIWYYGKIGRTAWIDKSVFAYPVAAAMDNYLYYHEFGIDDGQQNPSTAISAYIESSPIDIGDGDNFMFVDKLIPDITFRQSTNNPVASFTIKSRNFPGADFSGSDASSVARTATVPVEQFTNQTFIRLRGRSMAIRVESDQVGTSWRLGSPRINIRPDGRR